VDAEERRSTSVDAGPFVGMIQQAVSARLPDVLPQLGYERFRVSRVEVGATAYCHGDYFRMHHDGDEGNRPISFVYFCHREPKAFSGGELRIVAGSGLDDLVTPVANAAVFFPSDIPHEVLPVDVPSRQFADSRLTFHGWVPRDPPSP
jgi:SM-20-related protein